MESVKETQGSELCPGSGPFPKSFGNDLIQLVGRLSNLSLFLNL